MTQIIKNNFYDSEFPITEQLPKVFEINFGTYENDGSVRVTWDSKKQLGDVIDDNSYESDHYRFHDIFHYTFATILGWSPCARAMMKKKRKSNPIIDRVEDGARAIIIEEAISMVIFREAKKNNFFRKSKRVSKNTLKIVKDMASGLEVKNKTFAEWNFTILKAYEIFRLLVENSGGLVRFDSWERSVTFQKHIL